MRTSTSVDCFEAKVGESHCDLRFSERSPGVVSVLGTKALTAPSRSRQAQGGNGKSTTSSCVVPLVRDCNGDLRCGLRNSAVGDELASRLARTVLLSILAVNFVSALMMTAMKSVRRKELGFAPRKQTEPHKKLQPSPSRASTLRPLPDLDVTIGRRSTTGAVLYRTPVTVWTTTIAEFADDVRATIPPGVAMEIGRSRVMRCGG